MFITFKFSDADIKQICRLSAEAHKTFSPDDAAKFSNLTSKIIDLHRSGEGEPLLLEDAKILLEYINKAMESGANFDDAYDSENLRVMIDNAINDFEFKMKKRI